MRYSAVHSIDSLSSLFGHTVVWLLPIIAHAQRKITFLSKNSCGISASGWGYSITKAILLLKGKKRFDHGLLRSSVKLFHAWLLALTWKIESQIKNGSSSECKIFQFQWSVSNFWKKGDNPEITLSVIDFNKCITVCYCRFK